MRQVPDSKRENMKDEYKCKSSIGIIHCACCSPDPKQCCTRGVDRLGRGDGGFTSSYYYDHCFLYPVHSSREPCYDLYCSSHRHVDCNPHPPDRHGGLRKQRVGILRRLHLYPSVLQLFL